MSLASSAHMMSAPDLAPPEPGDAQLAVSKIKVLGRKHTNVLFAVLFLGLSVVVLGILATSAGSASKVTHVVQLCAEIAATKTGTIDEASLSQFISDLLGTLAFLNLPVFGSIAVGVAWMALLYNFARQVTVSSWHPDLATPSPCSPPRTPRRCSHRRSTAPCSPSGYSSFSRACYLWPRSGWTGSPRPESS